MLLKNSNKSHILNEKVQDKIKQAIWQCDILWTSEEIQTKMLWACTVNNRSYVPFYQQEL